MYKVDDDGRSASGGRGACERYVRTTRIWPRASDCASDRRCACGSSLTAAWQRSECGSALPSCCLLSSAPCRNWRHGMHPGCSPRCTFFRSLAVGVRQLVHERPYVLRALSDCRICHSPPQAYFLSMSMADGTVKLPLVTPHLTAFSRQFDNIWAIITSHLGKKASLRDRWWLRL